MLYARGSTAEWLALNQCDGGSNPPGRTKFVGKWRSLVSALGLEPRVREFEFTFPTNIASTNSRCPLRVDKPGSWTRDVPGVLGQQGLQSPSNKVRFLVPVPVVSSVVQRQRQRA